MATHENYSQKFRTPRDAAEYLCGIDIEAQKEHKTSPCVNAGSCLNFHAKLSTEACLRSVTVVLFYLLASCRVIWENVGLSCRFAADISTRACPSGAWASVFGALGLFAQGLCCCYFLPAATGKRCENSLWPLLAGLTHVDKVQTWTCLISPNCLLRYRKTQDDHFMEWQTSELCRPASQHGQNDNEKIQTRGIP